MRVHTWKINPPSPVTSAVLQSIKRYNLMHRFPLITPIIVLCLVMTTTTPASCEEPDFTANLNGTWKSDWKLTKRHIDAQCKLNEEEIAGLRFLMGKMTVRYEGERAVFTMPELRLTKEGKTRIIEGWTSEETVKILGRTKSQIALLTEAVAPGFDKAITLVNFESADVYWVYLGSSPVAGHHVKEYFRKVSPSSH